MNTDILVPKYDPGALNREPPPIRIDGRINPYINPVVDPLVDPAGGAVSSTKNLEFVS